MATIRELYDDWIKNRLSWMTVRRDKEEALLKAIVDELEALRKIGDRVVVLSGDADLGQPAKRGPGRPPKTEAA